MIFLIGIGGKRLFFCTDFCLFAMVFCRVNGFELAREPKTIGGAGILFFVADSDYVGPELLHCEMQCSDRKI